MNGGLDRPAEGVRGMLHPHAEPGAQLAEVEGMPGPDYLGPGQLC